MVLPADFKLNYEYIMDLNKNLENKMGFREEFDSIFKGNVCVQMTSKQENGTWVSQDGSTLDIDCESDQLLSSGLETLTVFLKEQARKILDESKDPTSSPTIILNSEVAASIDWYRNYLGTAYEYLSHKLASFLEESILLGYKGLHWDWGFTICYLILISIRDRIYFMRRYQISFKEVHGGLKLIPEQAYLASEEMLDEIFGEKRLK